MNRKSGLLVALLASVSLSAMAQTPAPVKDPAATPRVDTREANQQRRIDQGVKSGSLTEQEAARLEKGQARIEKMEDKAKADGKVTAKERERLHKAENKQSEMIYKEKHDRQRDRNHDGKRDRHHKK